MWFIPFIFILLTLSGCGDDSDPRVLTNLQVTASENPIPEGFQSKLTATAFYDDGNSNTTDATWESLDETKATVDIAGLVTAVAEGEVTIRATTAEGSGTFLLSVTPATLKSIELSPLTEEVSLGFNVNYEAIGYFSDRTSHNINDHPDLVWKSSNESVAVIVKGAPGEKIARSDTLSEGTTTFTAVLGISSNEASLTVNEHVLQSITITPERVTWPLGLTEQFTAEGVFSDEKTKNISDDVIWSSTVPSVLELVENSEESGVFKGITVGSSNVTASYKDEVFSDNEAIFIVEKLEMTAFTVDSPNSVNSQPIGKEIQFKAMAKFTDDNSYDVSGYRQVHWQSSDPSIATVTLAGLVKGLTKGEVIITASSAYDNATAFKDIEITNAVVESIVVEAVDGNQIITEGKTQQYNAFAVYTDKTISENVEASKEFTWSATPTILGHPYDPSEYPEVSIDEQGKLTYLKAGRFAGGATVGGDFMGINGVMTLLLPNAELELVSEDPISKEFIGALTQAEADVLTVKYSRVAYEEIDNGNYFKYVIMTHDEAVQYCENLHYNGNENWRLPSKDELLALWQTADGVDDNFVFSDGWVFGKDYWSTTINDSGHDAVSLYDVSIIAANDDELYYASCVRSIE
jgi:uncharacterized protein YjdB